MEELNERAMSIEEVWEAVNEMKAGKTPGLDGFPAVFEDSAQHLQSSTIEMEKQESNYVEDGK